MAIVAFWSHEKKKTNQTTSMIVSAVQMAIEKNYKILMIDANFNSSGIREALLIENKKRTSMNKQLNLGKVDIS